MKIPYLMHAEALELKTLALKALNEPIDPSVPEAERDLVVPAQALLSLIEQAHSAQLGLATTKEITEEYESRVVRGDRISRAPDYKTFDPNVTY